MPAVSVIQLLRDSLLCSSVCTIP